MLTTPPTAVTPTTYSRNLVLGAALGAAAAVGIYFLWRELSKRRK